MARLSGSDIALVQLASLMVCQLSHNVRSVSSLVVGALRALLAFRPAGQQCLDGGWGFVEKRVAIPMVALRQVAVDGEHGAARWPRVAGLGAAYDAEHFGQGG